MDAGYEEDDEVFVHARDPYHRIDVLNSSREVRVVVGGHIVAAIPTSVMHDGINAAPGFDQKGCERGDRDKSIGTTKVACSASM